MKLRLSVLAMLAATPALVNAAALDRSGQSVAPFFEKGNYAELSYVYVDPDIPGTVSKDVKITAIDGSAMGGSNVKGSAAKAYGYTSAAVKFEPAKNVRAAVIYDEPFGVDYLYSPKELTNPVKGFAAEVNTQNITTLVGTAIVPNVWVYGGLAFQDTDAQVDLGPGYSFTMNDSAVGYVGGAAFEKPEIALRAALTYRSEIEHKDTATERVFVPILGAVVPLTSRSAIKMPSSVNLDFQTGINKTTLLSAGVRWVEWTAFQVNPEQFVKANNRSLSSYEEDQISAYLGLGKRLTNNFAGSVRLMYDTGAGDKMSPFGPYKEKVGIAVGGKYNFNKNVAGSLGVSYTHLAGKGINLPRPARVPAIAWTEKDTIAFDKDSSAIAIGGKIGYRF